MPHTVLFVWELGGGLGHVMRLAPIANDLVEKGHRVCAALRELTGAIGAFDPQVRLLPAPFRSGPPAPPRATQSFADILDDVTFGDDKTMAAHVAAWRNLYDFVRPDVIVFDHSPTALLAARGLSARRVVTGTGFTVPADTYPFASLRPWTDVDAQRLRDIEQPILHRTNRILEKNKQPPLEHLGQLYSDGIDRTLLTVFTEFDPYAAWRPNKTRYLGTGIAAGGASPEWPPGAGPKVFAYLKPFAALPKILKFLHDRSIPTIAYIEALAPALRERYASMTLHFAPARLDLREVGQSCDLAIMNGSLASSVAMLLAGVPSLQIPIFLEHALNARAVANLGAGFSAPIKQPEKILDRLSTLLGSKRFKAAAKAFADKHASFDADLQSREMCGTVGALL